MLRHCPWAERPTGIVERHLIFSSLSGVERRLRTNLPYLGRSIGVGPYRAAVIGCQVMFDERLGLKLASLECV